MIGASAPFYGEKLMRRHKHNLSHYKLFTGDMGLLYPIACLEVLPGDTFRHSTSLLLRCSPLLAPIMHRVDIRVHHFYVPRRILPTPHGAENWEDFITGINDTELTRTNTQSSHGTLWDYLGLQANGSNPTVSGAPVIAYNMIYNEYYRDQDLEDEVALSNDEIRRVSWHKDYFTAARPWPQKGDPVTIPIGTTADVVAGPNGPFMTSGVNRQLLTEDDADVTGQYLTVNPADTEGVPLELDLQADLTSATSADVRDVRTAFALQRYQEARARYGSRYTEYLRYLGVKSSDSRLQRPEYLGGGKQTISFSEVLQTAEGTNPVGEMRGHGIAAMRSNRYQRFFEEHGYVISLFSVVPRNVYDSATPRHWFKTQKEDFYQRELQDIGHQEVFNGEIYAQSGDQDRNEDPNYETFGYSPRYSEYFGERSQVAGEFHDILDYWHMARKFDSLPTLNEDFIKCNPSKRNFAAQENHVLWCAARHSIGARRLVRKSNVGRII